MYKLAHQSLDKAIPDRTTVMNFGHLPDTQAYSHRQHPYQSCEMAC